MNYWPIPLCVMDEEEINLSYFKQCRLNLQMIVPEPVSLWRKIELIKHTRTKTNHCIIFHMTLESFTMKDWCYYSLQADKRVCHSVLHPVYYLETGLMGEFGHQLVWRHLKDNLMLHDSAYFLVLSLSISILTIQILAQCTVSNCECPCYSEESTWEYLEMGSHAKIL